MKHLIERLEKATDSVFELSRAITNLDWYREQFGDSADDEVPDFIRSMDASATLVPGHAIWDIASTGAAWIDVPGEQELFTGKGRFPAAGLTIAALKAREEMK